MQNNDDEEERRSRRSNISTHSTDESLNVKRYLQMFNENVSYFCSNVFIWFLTNFVFVYRKLLKTMCGICL